MEDGRLVGEMRQPCMQTIIGLSLAPSWGSGFGLISGPFSDSFLVPFGGGFGTHFGADLERLKYIGK